jgi:hypothetical protein
VIIEDWLAMHRDDLSKFDALDEPHRSVRLSRLFGAVAAAIKTGDRSAITVAIELFRHDPKMPFGKTIKCCLARALYGQRTSLHAGQLRVLRDLAIKLQALPHPPTEMKYVVRAATGSWPGCKRQCMRRLISERAKQGKG